MLQALLVLLGCYLVGSIPFPIIVSKLVLGIDLREHGSGNMGATNAGRVLGKRWFPVVFGLDFFKGAVAAYAARVLLPMVIPAISPDLGAALGAAVAVLGHCFPVYVGFKGGVGLAASAGALVVINPWMLVTVGLSILVFWRLARNMYVGTAAAVALAPVYAWFLLQQVDVTVATVAWAALVFALHVPDVKIWWAERKAG